jgi:molybdopterin molybdotransferase
VDLLPVDEALARILDGATSLGAETVPIADCGGRVLAAAVIARRSQPPFPASAMDGYAVRAADAATVGARLDVIGSSAAGHRFAGALGRGQAVRVFTGAPVPDGADAILLQEDADAGEPGAVVIREAVTAGRHIRKAGLDFASGDVLLEAGRVLDPAALALAAAGNHAVLEVVTRPLIAIIATGDELVAPGETPGPDQIVASNNLAIAEIGRRTGARILDLGIVRDDREAIAASIARARTAGASIIVTLGGASVGDHDLVRPVLLEAGVALDFWRIAMRPGKPLMYGRFGDTHVLGLPGNPVSAIVCAHLFLGPLAARLGGSAAAHDIRDGILTTAMKENDKRRDYVRAKTELRDGALHVTPSAIQDSSMLSVMAASDALLIREPHAPAAQAGDPCRVLMLR